MTAQHIATIVTLGITVAMLLVAGFYFRRAMTHLRAIEKRHKGIELTRQELQLLERDRAR